MSESTERIIRSDERIERATEVLWKLWWFSWWIIIAPFVIALVSFFLIGYIIAVGFPGPIERAITYSLSFSVIIFIFSILLFYKAYDRYRNKPFFKNQTNNLSARIYLLFIITILSMATTPIFNFLAKGQYTFELLPLISFIILYNIVWFYFNSQPITGFNKLTKEFFDFSSFTSTITRLHNLVIILNYFVHIIFLSILFDTSLSWFFGLFTNIVFLIITLILTQKSKKLVIESIKADKWPYPDLIDFQKRYVNSILCLNLCLLIQLPIIVMSLLILPSSLTLFDSLLALYVITVFLMVIFKMIIYSSVYYSYQHQRVVRKGEISKSPEFKKEMIQIQSSLFSSILMTLIFIFSIIIDLSVLILIILPFFYLIIYFEQKASYCRKNDTRYVALLNSVLILATFTFFLMPLFWNFQVIIFLIALYFILQIFVKIEFFKKENIIVIQNVLAVFSFIFIAFSFYDVLLNNYIILVSDQTFIFLSEVLVRFLLSLIVLLLSFYRLYNRHFREGRSKTFRFCILINILLIELIIFILINFRVFYLVDILIYLNILTLSLILFPIIFISFLFINYLIGVISRNTFLVYTYYSCWLLSMMIFSSIIIIYFNAIGFIVSILVLSICFNIIIKFGKEIGKVRPEKFEGLIKWSSAVFTADLFILLVTSLIILQCVIFISIFISTLIICLLINLDIEGTIFSRNIRNKVNIISSLEFSFVITYYSVIFTFRTAYLFIVPVLLASISLYLPIILFERIKPGHQKSMIVNSIIASLSIIMLPTIVGLELLRLERNIDFFLIIASTLFLILIFSKFLDKFSALFKIKGRQIIYLKFFHVLTWFITCTLISIDIFYYGSVLPINSFVPLSFLVFFLLNSYNIMQTDALIQEIYVLRDEKFNYQKISNFLQVYKRIIIWGILVSLPISFSINILEFINIFYYFSYIFAFILISHKIIEGKYEFEVSKIENTILFSLWLYIEVILIIFFISIIQFSIFNQIFLVIIMFSILHPITLYFYEKIVVLRKKFLSNLKMGIVFAFFISFIFFYIEILWFFLFNVNFLLDNPPILLALIISVAILIFVYGFFSIMEVLKSESVLILYRYYLLVIIISIGLSYVNPIASIYLLYFITYPTILFKKSKNVLLWFFSYFVLSFITYLEWVISIVDTNAFPGFELSINHHVLIFLSSLIGVFLISIIINCKTNTLLEKISLYLSISAWTFFFIILYTNILLLYNLTITAMVFLFFTGIFLYRTEDNRYKSFIKPFIFLFIFNFISYLSYRFLFILPSQELYNPILTLTLTVSTTGYAFIFLYNKSSDEIRNNIFRPVLILIVFSVPTFLYFLFNSYFPIELEEPIPIIIAMNIGIFLFYLNIGIYQWKISWAIWKVGWRAWVIFPIINFIIIYNIVVGIDVISNATSLIGEVDTFIISLIIAILFYLPVFYTWIKEHFKYILISNWAISLYIIYYISFNVFLKSPGLIILSFLLFSVIILTPMLYILKAWKFFSFTWLFLAIINTSFLFFLFMAIGMLIQIIIPLNLIFGGFYLMVFSFFPNVEFKKDQILIGSYFTVITGVFFTFFFLLWIILLNFFISIYLALIIMSLALYSSKKLKIDQEPIHYAISIILMASLSLLTHNTFFLIPGLEWFALFFSITIFGATWYAFNHYEMIKTVDRGAPWMIMALGTSSTITSLIFIFIPTYTFTMWAVWIAIMLLFLYFILEDKLGYMWYLVPVPLALIFLDFIGFFNPIWVLWFAFLYILIFQLLINTFNYLQKGGNIYIKKSLRGFFEHENVIKLINLSCFFFNSYCISLIISITIPVFIIHQILIFSILSSILSLISVKYIFISKLTFKTEDILEHINKISSFFYVVISLSITLLIILNPSMLMIYIIYIVIGSLLLFSGTLFLELVFIDKYLLLYLSQSTRKKMLFWSWLILANSSCIYFLPFHINPFLFILLLSLANLITINLLSQIGKVKQAKVLLVKNIILISSICSFSFYISSLIIMEVEFYLTDLIGVPMYLLFFSCSTIIIYIFTIKFLIAIPKKQQQWIAFILFSSFQGLLAVYWIFSCMIFNIVNYLMINLIIFIETLLFLINFNHILFVFSQKIRDGNEKACRNKIISVICIISYVEINIISCGLFNLIFGIFESILFSQIIILFFTCLAIWKVGPIKQKYEYLIHSISYLSLSISLFLTLSMFFLDSLILIGFSILILVLMQFYTIQSFYNTFCRFNPDDFESYLKKRDKLISINGAVFYGIIMLIIWIYLISFPILLPTSLQLLLIGFAVYGLMILDQKEFKFLKKYSNPILFMSWLLVMISSWSYLTWIFYTYLIDIIMTIIPLIVLIFILELIYLFKLLEFKKFTPQKKKKIKDFLLRVLYLDFITWPLYYLTFDYINNLTIFVISFLIIFIITHLDDRLDVFKLETRKHLRSMSFLVFGSLFSLETYFILESYVGPNVLLNSCIALLILTNAIGYILRPFKESHYISFLYWVINFILLNLIILAFSSSSELFGWLLTISLALYPFIFMLEELREIFNKFLEVLIENLKKLGGFLYNALTRVYKTIADFFKAYYKPIWIVFSIIFGIAIGILMSQLVWNYLNPVHSILLGSAIFGLLFSALPTEESSDPNVFFKRKMLRLIIVWGSILGVLFSFISPIFYVFMSFISILILGAVLLPYIYFKEQKEKISIKYRFYSTIFFILVLIITILLLVLQFTGIIIIE